MNKFAWRAWGASDRPSTRTRHFPMLLRLRRPPRRVTHASSAEHILECVVALMTRVLVHDLIGPDPWILARPRSLPGRRVLNRKPIEQRLGVEPAEPLDHMEILARALKLRLVGEVGRVDDERVALPMPDRISHPALDLFRQVLSAHADDPRIVDHLVEDHHRVTRLHDLLQIVVEVIGQRGWSRRRTEPEQTPLSEGTR